VIRSTESYHLFKNNCSIHGLQVWPHVEVKNQKSPSCLIPSLSSRCTQVTQYAHGSLTIIAHIAWQSPNTYPKWTKQSCGLGWGGQDSTASSRLLLLASFRQSSFVAGFRAGHCCHPGAQCGKCISKQNHGVAGPKKGLHGNRILL